MNNVGPLQDAALGSDEQPRPASYGCTFAGTVVPIFTTPKTTMRQVLVRYT
jgi:hypothetical protein